MKPWYPDRPSEQDIIRKIMRDTWMAGYNVKQIAGYFKLSTCSVYNKVNIRGLKRKKNAFKNIKILSKFRNERE